MYTVTSPLPALLQLVTGIARSVSHGHQGIHRSRLAGHVGTGNTLLVAPTAQRHGGKHRAVSA